MDASVTTTLSAIDPARYRDRIRTELVAALCARLPTVMLIEVVLSSAIIASGLWGVATALQLMLWLMTHSLIVLLHGYVYLRFRAQSSDQTGQSLEQVRRLLVLGMFLVSVFWAVLLGFLFAVIPDYIYQLYILLFVAALGVLAVAVTSEDLLVLTAFVVPISLGVSLMAIGVGQPKYVATGLLGILSTAALMLFARTRNRGLVESLAMRFALVDLAHELSEQRDAAHRANIAKSQFLAAASHDLRQPLHALSLLASALHSSDIDTNTRGIANDMSTAIGSLETMFSALLDVSRLDAGVLQSQPKHFRLGLLLHRITAEYLPTAQANGVQLLCDDCSVVAHTDPVLLERVVRNYLANALRYTHVGEVRITCEQVDQGIRISVTDTGIGIAREQHAEIFSEFYQIGNPERDRTKGLGLGLAIVRRIADLLHVPIGIHSELGRGACFFVIVPVGDAALIAPVRAVQPEPQHSLVGLRVLVIDDDIAVRDGMRRLLAAWQCHVAIAGDATQAMDSAHASFGCPDALIVDYRLREHRTGIEAIAELRAKFKADIPALIVSGDTAPARLREVADSGHTMIHKPAQPAALRSFLLSALRLKNSPR